MDLPWRRRKKRPPTKRKPLFYIEGILSWADAWQARTGAWPTLHSGAIPESPSDKWRTVDAALRNGRRGLPGGSSLARLLAERRGVRNRKDLRPYTVAQILTWADAHHSRTGDWPTVKSGTITEAPGETWSAVNMALTLGCRGLPGGSSLAHVLAQERGKRSAGNLTPLSVALILSWADAYHQRTGAWPWHRSGPIPEAPGESWLGMEGALRAGHRGLPGGSSLARLLVKHGRGRRPPPRGLQRLRLQAGLSRQELANKTGVAPATVSDWEIGRSLPRPKALAALAGILGLSAEKLGQEMRAAYKGRQRRRTKQ